MHRRVGSGAIPADIEKIQGKTLVNFDVQEVIGEEGEVTYSYEQLLLQKDAPQELIDKEIAKRLVEIEYERKVSTLDTLTVEADTIAYDADGKSLGNMASVLSVANFKFNQAIAAGTPLADAYTYVYETETIGWKTVQNTVELITIAKVANALEVSMHRVAEVIGAK